MKTLSIKQYQNQYPRVSAVPSITQSGGLATLLARIEQKEARRLRRRALLGNIVQRARTMVKSLQLQVAHRLDRNRTAVAQPPRTI